MNSLLLLLLLSFVQAEAAPIGDTIPTGAKASEANDPTIVHLSQTLAMLNEYLIDAVAKTRDPEKSKLIKNLREKIGRTEDAIEERKAILRAPRVFPLPPAPVVVPFLMWL